MRFKFLPYSSFCYSHIESGEYFYKKRIPFFTKGQLLDLKKMYIKTYQEETFSILKIRKLKEILRYINVFVMITIEENPHEI